jgi:hypothetical protein
MVCPQCNGVCEQNQPCPSCAHRRLCQAMTTPIEPAVGVAVADEPWQHTAPGRILVGLMLAQGLAYGLRLLATAAWNVGQDQTSQALWATLGGLLLLQGMQGISLLVGGGLAAAGQQRGILLGSVVGLVNGFVTVIVQQLNGDPVTEALLYGQPALHMAFGMLGGLVGTRIWKPLPPLSVACPPGEKKKGPPPARPNPVLAAPVSWGRVMLGTVVVLTGVFWPKALLAFVLDASQGKMTVSTHLQAQLVTWEVSALVVLLGAVLGGSSSASGLKQGICVGIAADLCYLAALAGGHGVNLDQTVPTLAGVLVLSLVGGWFGGRLFPPVLSLARRRALHRARLSRAEG